MKTLIYSPVSILDEQSFFEEMEYASTFGADIIVFGEGVKTPYHELLSGMDVLNAEEYNYVLESLYGFCFEFGGAAVFNNVDDFGMHFSIFVNPFAEDGETFNKLYIKHATDKGSVFELEDYEQCAKEIFQPIVFKGTKIGMTMGNDIYLPKLFERYRLNGVTTVFNCFDKANPEYEDCMVDLSVANNMVVVSAGMSGEYYVSTPCGEKQVQKLSDNLYISEFDKCDFAKKCSLLKNDLSEKYVPKDKMELYKLL